MGSKTTTPAPSAASSLPEPKASVRACWGEGVEAGKGTIQKCRTVT